MSKEELTVRCNREDRPGAIVCVHLLRGESKDWRPVPDFGDWLCPACLSRWPYLDEDDVRLVCRHCAIDLRTQAEEYERELIEAEAKQIASSCFPETRTAAEIQELAERLVNELRGPRARVYEVMRQEFQHFQEHP